MSPLQASIAPATRQVINAFVIAKIWANFAPRQSAVRPLELVVYALSAAILPMSTRTNKMPPAPADSKGSYAFVSLGCPKNLVDSERMLGLLQIDGYELVNDPDGADFVAADVTGFGAAFRPREGFAAGFAVTTSGSAAAGALTFLDRDGAGRAVRGAGFAAFGTFGLLESLLAMSFPRNSPLSWITKPVHFLMWTY